jgi:hypothetical protein
VATTRTYPHLQRAYREPAVEFEDAVKQYDSCQPYATGKWRADLVRHRKWDSEILADLQRRFAPLSGDQTGVTDPRRARSLRKERRWRTTMGKLKVVRRPKMKSQ